MDIRTLTWGFIGQGGRWDWGCRPHHHCTCTHILHPKKNTQARLSRIGWGSGACRIRRVWPSHLIFCAVRGAWSRSLLLLHGFDIQQSIISQFYLPFCVTLWGELLEVPCMQAAWKPREHAPSVRSMTEPVTISHLESQHMFVSLRLGCRIFHFMTAPLEKGNWTTAPPLKLIMY